jgi:hypothetical protein
MTGNGFVIPSSGGSASNNTNTGAGSGGLMKSKSGSLPDRYSARGFRDTFVSSMTPPIMSNSANSSPHHHLAGARSEMSSPAKESLVKEGTPTPSQNGNKKWTFGGLFKRKSKTPSVVGSPSPLSIGGGSMSMSASPSPAPSSMNNGMNAGATVVEGGILNSNSNRGSPRTGNASRVTNYTPTPVPVPTPPQVTKYVSTPTQTRQKGKLSESDLSSEDSELENESWSRSHENNAHQIQQQQPISFKQNFLTRRLSRRREKAAAKKKAAEETSNNAQQQVVEIQNGFLKVPRSGQLNNGKRVGSSQDSLNNGNAPPQNNVFGFGSNGPWPSWEITKKVPTLQAPPNNNYSSSGSLSLSFEGSTKESRAAAKEAVKARAVARRESFFQDSSSEDDGEDISRSSIQGSHSSLSSRNRRRPLPVSGNASSGSNANIANNGNHAPRQTLAQLNNPSFRTASDYTSAPTRGSPASSAASPAKFDYQNNNNQGSPNFNGSRKLIGPAPGSPRWEARVVYTQVNVEDDTPFVVKLPKSQTNQGEHLIHGGAGRQKGYVMSTEATSEDTQQQVITAGLRVPISGQAQQSNGQYITEEVHYANLPNAANNHNLRQRSATPQQLHNYPRGYNNVSPSPPPPPPPRRDFNRAPPNNALNKSQTNPNFYRPVSCSYLDAYEGFYAQQQLQQQQSRNSVLSSPSRNLNSGNVMSFSPVHNANHPRQVYPDQLHHNGNYYQEQGQDQVDNSRDFIGKRGNNSSFLGSKGNPYHPNLARFPSEPPEIKIQGVREQSPLKRNASTPSPSPYHQQHHQYQQQGNPGAETYLLEEGGGAVESNGIGNSKMHQPVIMSKLGFPVRRLHEANKIPPPQSPVHMRASEFWRKKDAEVTGNPVQGNPNHKKYMNRIRSADSSPLPIPRMRASPANNMQNSNESISSLSSFSAEAPSPHHMFVQSNGKTIVNPGFKMGRRHPNMQQGLNFPHQQLAYSNPSPDQGQNVGSGRGSQNSNRNDNNNANQREGNSNSSPGRNDGNSSRNPGSGSGAGGIGGGGGGGGRIPGNNNSGRNNNNPPGSDNKKEKTPSQSATERLKVRAPSVPPIMTPTSTSEDNKGETEGHKIVRSLVDLNNGKTPGRNLEDALNELEDMYKSLRLSDEDLLDRAERRDLPTPHQELRNAPLIPLPQHGHFRFEPLGSVESLATGSSGSGGTNYSSSGGDNQGRVRAPPLRRSSRPDTVSDDMARRKCYQAETKPLDPRNVVSKTGSYMVLSPAFSPPVSPCPPETLPLSICYSVGSPDEPDLTLDDVTFRNYRKANSIRIIDPQPPFGIPLGPITAAPGTDYLHSKRSDRLRPLFKATRNPDLVNDDIAFRNLRKDLNTDNNLSKDWTPRLFSPTRDNNVFNFGNGHESGSRDKKLRAIRSLSANVTNFIPFTEYSFNSSEMGKWNSFTDLHHQRQNTRSPLLQTQQPQKRRASTYLQPSWVEQIEKVQTSTETLTENRNSNNKFALESAEHWERKLPSKTVQLTPELYDPTKPRRPWTDIILDSFEKEKQNEIEQIAQETAAAAAANANFTSNSTTNDNDTPHNDDTTGASKEERGSHPANNLEITEEDDDDVFLTQPDTSQSKHPQNTQLKVNPSSESVSKTVCATPEVSMIQATVMDTKDSLLDESQFLLLGQKTRRGSWVEPRRSSSSHLSSSDLVEDDKRRKSWSYLPKDLEDAPSSDFVSSSGKRLFTPLPPPRKIKQINLFSTSSTNASSPSTPTTKAINEVNYLKEVGGEKDKAQNVRIPSSPSKREEELNELMDMLIREADTCGPSETMTNPPSAEPDAAAISPTTTVGGAEEEGRSLSTFEEEEERVKCSSKQRVKPSLSSEVTQKDMLDGNRASLPKIPSVVETAKNEPESLHDDTKHETLAPEVISVIQKSTSTKQVSSSIPPPPSTPSKKESNQPSSSLQIDKSKTSGVTEMRSSPKSTNFTSTTTSTSQHTISTTTTPIAKSCSIEELIDSINESLPELEASCASQKSNESSLSSVTGSSPPSLPSPRPGSPTMITFPVRTHTTTTTTTTTDKKKDPQHDDDAAADDAAEGNTSEDKLKSVTVKEEMSMGQTSNSSSSTAHHGNETVTRMDCEEKADELAKASSSAATVHDQDKPIDSSSSSSRITTRGIPLQEESSSNETSGKGKVVVMPLSLSEPEEEAGPSSSTSSKGMMVKKSPEGEMSSRSVARDWFAQWNGVLLVACYLLAFTHTLAQLDFLPFVGLFLALLVFFCASFLN